MAEERRVAGEEKGWRIEGADEEKRMADRRVVDEGKRRADRKGTAYRR
jgi:hypothetical protein